MADTSTTAKVQDIKAGEYVQRKPDAVKVYKRGGYDRSTRRFELIDCDDIGRSIWVKRDTQLVVGFTY